MNQAILKKYMDYVWCNHDKRNTRLTYTDHPRKLLRHINKPFEQITQKDIDNFVQWSYKNRSHNGNAIRFWSIRKFLKWADSNLIMPIVNPVDAGRQALTSENFEKVIDTLPELRPLHRVVGYALTDTIRRPSEIKNIKIKNIYNDRLKYDGKTGVKYCIMTDRLKEAINEYIEKQRPIPQTPLDDDYLILSEYGRFKGQHLKTRGLISRIVKEIAMYSDIDIPQDETACSYLFKRTTITEQLDQYPAKYVQFQAGHIKPETTMKYQRPRDNDIKKYLTSFEHKKPKIKENLDIEEHKSFLISHETHQTFKHKMLMDEEDNGSFSFTISFFCGTEQKQHRSNFHIFKLFNKYAIGFSCFSEMPQDPEQQKQGVVL